MGPVLLLTGEIRKRETSFFFLLLAFPHRMEPYSRAHTKQNAQKQILKGLQHWLWMD